MMGGDEVKISELLLAELDPTVGIRKTLERVPELSAQLGGMPSYDLARFQPEF